MVFELLNKLFWGKELDNCEIIILHRGATDDKKVISGSVVTGIKRHYFYYLSGNREITIPLHRVIELKVDGRIVWKRNTKKG